MKKFLHIPVACLLVISSPIMANGLVGKGLSALGAVADVDQLFGDESSALAGATGSNIGALLLEQEVQIIDGELEGSVLTLNELIASGSNIALLNSEQVVEFRQSDVTQSAVSVNFVNLDKVNVGYFEVQQLAEFIDANIASESVITVNSTSVENSNLLAAQIKQDFLLKGGASVNNTHLNGNIVTFK